MRTVSQAVIDAITTKESSRMLVQAEVQPSRTYFSTLADDYPYDAGDYSLPTDTPLGQAVCYSPTLDKIVTFIVETDGDIIVMEQGDATKTDLGIDADPATKPAVFDRNDGTADSRRLEALPQLP